jgi:predicted DNA-binding transcriptional regulator AlpA
VATKIDPTPQRELLTLDELIALTGWGKTKTYEGARAGTLPFPALRNGRRYYFSRWAYEAWRDDDTDSGSDGAACTRHGPPGASPVG